MAKKLPLSRFPFFSTTDVDQARESLARVCRDGKLSPVGSGKSFSHRFNVAPLGRATLTAMEWGCGMTFDAPPLDGCFEFATIIHGAGEARVGREIVVSDPNVGVVMSPSRPARLRLNDRQVGLNALVDRETLESHLAAIAGIELTEPLGFSAAMPMTGDDAVVWRLIRVMADELDRDQNLLTYPLLAERFSETLLTAILYAQPHNYSEALTQKALAAEPFYVRRAEEYMEAHCDEPITAQLLATIVGVSLRTLYTGFRKHRGYTPIEFLRRQRLRRVRAALLAAPADSSVNQIALRWGFNHLGRFSALYRKHYGESPSDTLRRRP